MPGQTWSSASPRGQWRTGENGEIWLQNHLWCPNDPRGEGIDDDDDDDDDDDSNLHTFGAISVCISIFFKYHPEAKDRVVLLAELLFFAKYFQN